MQVKKAYTKRCLNDGKGAFSGERYFSDILSDELYVDEVIFTQNLVDEATNEKLPTDRRGGIITFSTDMNSTKLSENAFVNFLKQKLLTVVNRITAMQKIDTVAKNFTLKGWTVTKGLHGKYIDRKSGIVFDEKSLSVELVGITTEVLLDVAAELCEEFKQQSVLVKSYENNDIWFVEL